ncbi:hypothetical protein [Nostoc sp. TCL26-01]|uniref:hypothetical protein n=1 Tax=Nostoc sp. TCL26-01 TaxID=2576904 RepID=UPI0015BBE137|nr:hypothetical protein [Nostoc sp. TCL26-01]QLE57749.1 hypothetical protein FD725_20850 [Nostoc sp. TCL26-01]
MNSFSRLPAFIRGSNTIRMQLTIESKPWEASPLLKLNDKNKQDILPSQSYSVELPPVFSHMNFLLIESLSETQHGEFITRSKHGRYETFVELSGHISHRYSLTPQEVAQIQTTYEQILEMWIAWRLSHR